MRQDPLPKIKFGLFLKFFLSLSFLIVLTSVTLSYFLIRNEVGNIQSELRKTGIKLVQNLAKQSEYGIAIGTRSVLRENLDKVIEEDDVLYAIVTDNRGNVLAYSEGSVGIPIPDAIRPTLEAAALEANSTKVQFYKTEIFNEPIYDIAFPIMSMRGKREKEEIGFMPESGTYQDKIGVARVGISLVKMDQSITELLNIAKYSTGGVILFGIVFMAIFVGVITKPIRELLSGMKKVAQGDLSHLKVTTGDEIGQLSYAFNRMVDDLEKYRKEIDGYRKSLESKVRDSSKEADELKVYSENIIATMAEGVIVVDLEGEIELVNKTLLDLTGYKENELVGHRLVSKLFPGNDREKAIHAMATVRKSGILREYDLVLNSKEGREVPVHFNAAILHDSAGVILGTVIILHDMTKERESDKMKTEFISTISHELRTPLTSIEGFVSLILNRKVGEISEKQEEFLKTVQTQSKHLKSLIQNLLDFSRFVTGRIQIKKSKISINDVINEVIEGFMPQIEQKEIKIKVDIEKDIPEIQGDSEKLGMAFLNILGNAVKFSDKGGNIVVRVAKSDKEIIVSVKDSGLGIEKENLKKVFERFYQIDSSLTRKIGGAGIGLAVAKEVAEAHGGKVFAESEGIGKGSTISFTVLIN